MSIIRLKPIVEQIVREYEGEQDLSKRRAVWIGMDEAIKELKTRFSEACEVYSLSQNWGIYRGYTPSKHKEKSASHKERSASGIFFIDPKKSSRTSKETNSFYTHWISDSPLWRDYPPRNKSVIGSFSHTIASDYGSLIFLVVPINGSRFAIVSDKDAWSSFPHTFSFFQTNESGGAGLDGIAESISWFFAGAARTLNLDKTLFDKEFLSDMMDKNPEEFLAKIEPHRKEIIENIYEIKEYLNGFISGPSRKKMTLMFADRIEQHQHLSSFEKMFDNMFDPKKNKVDLVNGIKPLYEKYDYSDRELWTDAECLLVPVTFRDQSNNIFVKIVRGEI